MFTSNNAEILDIEKKDRSNEPLKRLVYIHQRLKQIARIESQIKLKNKFNVASLSQEEVKKLKDLESSYGCLLVAYKSQDNHLMRKNKILNNIEILLQEYLKLFENNQKNIDDFSQFFE